MDKKGEINSQRKYPKIISYLIYFRFLVFKIWKLMKIKIIVSKK